MVVRERTAVSVVELYDAGRYRLAQELAAGLTGETAAELLALGLVEIARGNLDVARDWLSKLAFSSDRLAARARAHLAYAYILSGEVAEAKDLLKDLPDNFHKLLLKAIIE